MTESRGFLSSSIDLMRRARDAGHDSVIVGFSGGKDSWASLQLCSEGFKQVHAYFCYIVEGLEVEERSLRAAEARYGITIHRFPSPQLQHYLRNGIYTVRPVAFNRRMKDADICRVMRGRTGARLIASGMRMEESLQRRGMIHSTGDGFDEKNEKIYPLAHWNAKAVYSYLGLKRLTRFVTNT